MLWHNDLVVIDLETTDDEKDRHIIEIGAVRLDRELRLLDTFSSLCYPGNMISPFVEQLTGITQEELNQSPRFSEVFAKLINWIPGNLKRVRLCAWGNYFDINVLRQECKFWNIPYPFSGTAFDVKTVAALWCALSGRRTDKLGLQHVYKEMFPNISGGQWHRALADAVATAQVLEKAVKDLDGGVWLSQPGLTRGRYIQVREPKDVS